MYYQFPLFSFPPLSHGIFLVMFILFFFSKRSLPSPSTSFPSHPHPPPPIPFSSNHYDPFPPPLPVPPVIPHLSFPHHPHPYSRLHPPLLSISSSLPFSPFSSSVSSWSSSTRARRHILHLDEFSVFVGCSRSSSSCRGRWSCR